MWEEANKWLAIWDAGLILNYEYMYVSANQDSFSLCRDEQGEYGLKIIIIIFFFSWLKVLGKSVGG